MAGVNISERLAVVESKIEAVVQAAERREVKQDAILESISEVRSELARYKGFAGGILFVASGLALFVAKLAAPIYQWIRGHF